MGIDEFGYSGKTEDVLRKLKLDDDTITKKIEKLLKETMAENFSNLREIWTSKFLKLLGYAKISI